VTSITSKIILFFVLVTLSLVGGAYLVSNKEKTSVQVQEQNQAQKLNESTKNSVSKQNNKEGTNKASTPFFLQNYKSPYKKTNGYVFSRPSNGTLIKTHAIQIDINDDNTASAIIPKHKTSHNNKIQGNPIRKGQKVILHDKEGTILPLGGIITEIIDSEDSEGTQKIIMSLPTLIHDKEETDAPKDNNTDMDTDSNAPPLDDHANKDTPEQNITNIEFENLSREAKIITLEGRALQLFPLSAIQYDEDNIPYVWEIKDPTTQKKITVVKTLLPSFIVGDQYFRAKHPITAYTHLVLNPDSKLKNDTAYPMKKTRVTTPKNNPIKASYKALRRAKLEQELERMREEARNCRTGQQSSLKTANSAKTGGTMSTSCRQEKALSDLSAEDLFKSILSRRPKETGGASCKGGCARH